MEPIGMRYSSIGQTVADRTLKQGRDENCHGIVHDLGNLIQVVAAAIRIIGRNPNVTSDAALLPIVDRARTSLDAAGALVHQTMAYAREGRHNAPCDEVVDLQSTLSAMDGVLTSVCEPNIGLAFDVPDNLPTIRCSKAELQTALLNLVVNARDASRGRGSILIKARAHSDAKRTSLVLSITDQGEGMSEATRARAFEPLFTTKAAGRGTGYGLAMVQQFVHRSGGSAEIHSMFGRGTTISLIFPTATS
jgi:signal transduction histidine kinase